VLQTIRERLLKAGAQAKIKKAIEIAKRLDSTSQSKDEWIMADRDDFQSISKLLGRWKDELAAIQDCIDHRNRSLEPIPEALSILSRYSEITENLAKADQAKLAVAIRQTIASITIGIHDAKCGKISYREITGTLEFHPAFGIDPIEIPADVIGQRRIWREIGELARRSKQPIHLADVCEMIESTDPSHACYHMRRAEASDLVRKVSAKGGWVAVG
jgi:hypothetical protein